MNSCRVIITKRKRWRVDEEGIIRRLYAGLSNLIRDKIMLIYRETPIR